MADDRQYETRRALVRPGTYFNPQTEVLVVVDDSASMDNEIFNLEEFEGADWVLISDELPVDEAAARRAARELPGDLPRRRRAPAGEDADDPDEDADDGDHARPRARPDERHGSAPGTPDDEPPADLI